MRKTVKLTPMLLKKIVTEEVAKFGDMKSTEDAAKETEEVDADEFADTLEKKVDFMKALKIEESKLTKRLTVIREKINRIKKTL
jgi:hypothetical protein